MNVIIGGDIVTNNSNINLFNNGEIEKIIGNDLVKDWYNANYRIANLEAPITTSQNEIYKSGGFLRNDPRIIQGIKKMNFSCLALANNHIKDYGTEGLLDTINILNDNDIQWLGVGNNKDNLKKSIELNSNIVVYNCCEMEFSYANQFEAGANVFDEYETLNDIKNLKSKYKYVIVIYHGGKEYYRYPSPNLRNRCHKLIDAGADFVTCQHSHCIGCEEKYKNKNIVYGQGNFIFNKREDEYWNNSLLVKLIINKSIDVEYIPIVRTSCGTRKATLSESKDIMKEFNYRSSLICNSDVIEEKYNELSMNSIAHYLIQLSGNSLFHRIVYKISPKYFIKMYSKKKICNILNILRCEVHNELVITALQNFLDEKIKSNWR